MTAKPLTPRMREQVRLEKQRRCMPMPMPEPDPVTIKSPDQQEADDSGEDGGHGP